MWFLLGFFVLVLAEIALLIQLGGAIGLWLTLGWILLTGFLGIILLKGIGMLGGLMTYRLESFQNRNNPMAHRALVLIAGLFLLLPGLLTDAVGILLLFAPIRRVVIGFISRRTGENDSTGGTQVVDGEWRDVSTTARLDQRDSGQS